LSGVTVPWREHFRHDGMEVNRLSVGRRPSIIIQNVSDLRDAVDTPR
jgi:hypothetical protein